jgi:6-phosphogluconolactonase
MPHVHGIGRGIHLLRFDAGTATLRELQVDSHGVNPSYLCHSASLDLLYGVSEQEVGASIDVYAVDDAATLRHLLNVPTPGASPCHISLTPAADRLFVSNYGSGELLSYRLDGQGLPSAPPDIIVRHGSGPRSDRQASPHVHCAQPTPSGDAVYLCDLGTDSVARHALRGAALDLLPDLQVQIGPGSGPRHLRLNPAGTRAFVLNCPRHAIPMHTRSPGSARCRQIGKTPTPRPRFACIRADAGSTRPTAATTASQDFGYWNPPLGLSR